MIEQRPTYRERNNVDWCRVREEIKKGIKQCRREWAREEDTIVPSYLADWHYTILRKVDGVIDHFKHRKKSYNNKVTENP